MKALATVKRLIVHHSAGPRETTLETLLSMHRARGFAAIGYHLVIDGAGTVHSTRPLTVQGAHALGANHDSWGVCVLGDNTRDDRRWTEVQIEALERVVDSAAELVPGLLICGHRDAKGGKTATECPGVDIRALLGV